MKAKAKALTSRIKVKGRLKAEFVKALKGANRQIKIELKINILI